MQSMPDASFEYGWTHRTVSRFSVNICLTSIVYSFIFNNFFSGCDTPAAGEELPDLGDLDDFFNLEVPMGGPYINGYTIEPNES